jgi:regulator of protease activity HflC (stomatin/prohibitin superfamily)
MKTALQVINDMVKARLTQPEVDILDDTGQRGEGTISSREYRLLQDRGLKVLSVGISSPRFNPSVEDLIIRNWNATWLMNARMESEQIDRRRNIFEATAQEQAIRQYADALSREINEGAKKGKPTEKEMLKTLLLRSRSLIRSSDQLRRRMSTELQDVEDMIKWIEENGS